MNTKEKQIILKNISAKMKSKKTFFKQNYKQALDYISESKNYIYYTVAIFVFFSFVGFFLPAPENLFELISKFVEELVSKTQNMAYGELTGFIFLNNLQGSFFGMVYGIIFGIFPVIAAVANGYLLGFVASEAVNTAGVFVLWRLLPHGIFELPALFISLGLGLKLGTFIFQKNKFKMLKVYFLESIKVFFFVVIPLLIIAAIIEGTLIFFF